MTSQLGVRGDRLRIARLSDTPRGPLVAAVCVGIPVGAAVAATPARFYAPIAGWTAAGLSLAVLVWPRIARMDAEQTARHATVNDPHRSVADLLLLGASVAALVAVGALILHPGSSGGSTRWVDAVLAMAGVVSSWLVVHTLFTLKYAHHYYAGVDGGIDFNQREPPCYLDFAYLAFTIALTFQVSDTDITSSEIRRTALRHALLSYLFGAVILAMVVNLLASLGAGH